VEEEREVVMGLERTVVGLFELRFAWDTQDKIAFCGSWFGV